MTSVNAQHEALLDELLKDYPYSDTCRTCSSITKIYGASNTTSFCRLCPESRDSTWVNLVSTRK